ncbi:UNVERIFIED_CONTAM: hypothetical protein Sindi_0336700 [Sesamum indicum]
MLKQENLNIKRIRILLGRRAHAPTLELQACNTAVPINPGLWCCSTRHLMPQLWITCFAAPLMPQLWLTDFYSVAAPQYCNARIPLGGFNSQLICINPDYLFFWNS